MPGLDQAVTDILVRQKSLTVGLPPDSREKTIDTPLQSGEIETMILSACGDGDIAILQQEVILYLAMLIRHGGEIKDSESLKKNNEDLYNSTFENDPSD